ncbi:hypothetical protein E2C01_014485 [Portunus trituberculatus]|uniref:Uncharacterized protein n=1 Tax=Portunus trituberculatus TaxID=210409 RepID=A0A5B7DK80_PORTR|nr:hypothetical protein [Portunus trituberculatus]
MPPHFLNSCIFPNPLCHSVIIIRFSIVFPAYLLAVEVTHNCYIPTFLQYSFKQLPVSLNISLYSS